MYENLKTVKCELDGQIAVVTVNREEVLNSLNPEVYQELAAVFHAMAADSRVRAVIVTGAGSRAFVAGADISEMVNYSVHQAREFSLLANRSQEAITQMSKPTLAAINGYARSLYVISWRRGSKRQGQ